MDAPRPLPVSSNLLRYLRQPAVATGPGDAARRVGVPRASDTHRRAQAAPHLARSQRERQRREPRRSFVPQLGAGEPAHGGGARGEGLSVPVRVCQGGGAYGREGDAGDFAGGFGVALGGV